jgi:predicted regulator of Ras-like GTPase activity (Roadblock/LC7/MglB family)
LVTKDSLIKGSFPDRTAIQPDAIGAMSAAAFSLGERISDELGGGNLRYTLVAGVSGLHLCVVLNNNHLLALGLPSDVSVDAVLNTLRRSVAPIFDMLEIEQPPSWLVT